ncbi:hypothetical protein Trydic_g2355 [Trypoxylus dichotomus]
MRVAFLYLPIFVCAGLVLASQDHNGQNRHKGHDLNKRHHQMNRDTHGYTVLQELRDTLEAISRELYRTYSLLTPLVEDYDDRYELPQHYENCDIKTSAHI